MENHVVEVLLDLRPEKLGIINSRKDKNFLFALDKGKRLLILNSTGREIYNFCDSKRSVKEIIKNMKNLYPEIEDNKISVDVLKCLRDLEHRGFLVLR